MLRAKIIAVSLLAGPALAAPKSIVIAAGEHYDFSRIAFEATTENINAEQNGRTVYVRNIEQKSSYILDDIKVSHKAYRISDADVISTEQGNVLALTLNCDCRIETGVSNNGKFLIDIFDQETPAPIPTPMATPLPPSIKPALAASSAPQPKSDEISKNDRLSVEQAHKQMVALLEQAANEGLVTIKGSEASTTPAPAIEAHDGAVGSENDDTVEKNQSESSPLAQTEAENTPPKPTETVQLKCIPNAALTIDGENFSKDPIKEIANLQTALADAPSQQEKQIMRRLSEGYLSIGFGEEALALLKSYRQQDSILADIARIIAERDPRENSALVYAENCDGAHALWQLAENDIDDFSSQYAKTNSSLLELPSRLKVIIASRLALKAVSHEAWVEAKELLEIAKAATNAPVPELDFVEAMLKQKGGDLKKSRLALQRIASQNSSAAEEALLALADSYSKDGNTPYEGFAEDLGALARVTESTEAALIESSAWARIGNYEAALVLLRGVANKSPGEAVLARNNALLLLDIAFSKAAEPKQHIAALDALLAHKDWLGLDHIEQNRLLQYARTARYYGLPNLSYFLMNQIESANDTEFSHEKAVSAIEAGYADDAIRISAPHTDDSRFREIVAKANIVKGEYHSALATAATIEDDSLRAAYLAEAGWLAHSWSSVVRGSEKIDPSAHNEKTTLRYALAAYMENLPGLPPIIETVLGQKGSAMLQGLQSFFEKPAGNGSALERSRRSVESAAKEIFFIEKVLSDG